MQPSMQRENLELREREIYEPRETPEHAHRETFEQRETLEPSIQGEY